MRFNVPWAMLLAPALTLGVAAAWAVPIQNTADGAANGVALDPTLATVTLNNTGPLKLIDALAEITPTVVMASTVAQSFSYDVMPAIDPGAGVDRLDIGLPAGYANPAVTSVNVGASALAMACPTPGPDQYCATYPAGVISVTLGDRLTATLTVVHVEFTADTPGLAGTADFTSSVIDGATSLPTTVGDADGDPGDDNSITVEVVEGQGLVLQLTKTANKREVLVGDVVTYSVIVQNTQTVPVTTVTLQDLIPPNFKYVAASARLDGAAMPEPTGSRPLLFDLGTVPAWIDDAPPNGTVDPGEPGYRVLTYQLRVGAGARPGSYRNSVVAWDVCDVCFVSNETAAKVEVRQDPLFDLGTIIGKVFEDRNRDDRQDPDEPGVANAMVAMDDGTYALTDEYGRYHIPAVEPGQRMFKINLKSLPAGTRAATDESRIVQVTPGLMVRVNFGVVREDGSVSIGSDPLPAMALTAESAEKPLDIRGSAESSTVLINGRSIALPASDVRISLEVLEETVRITGGRLAQPIRFDLVVGPAGEVAHWSLGVTDGTGATVRTFEAQGQPPAEAVWDGLDQRGVLIGAGEIYQYQLQVLYRDGSSSTSPRRLFGVNRDEVISLNLMGEAFETARAALSPQAKQVLGQAVELLRSYPDEKVVIAGHTDSVGSDAYNLDLSRRRAQAAADYLIGEHDLPRDRFAVFWYGEEQPIAPNDIEEGRALNRRVEVKGEVEERGRTVLDTYRTGPTVRINGAAVDLLRHGRFGTTLHDPAEGRVEIELGDSEGRTIRTSVTLPVVEILRPDGRLLVSYGSESGGCRARALDDADLPLATCELVGRTQPGNRVELDGRSVSVGPDGTFATTVELALGANTFGLVARDTNDASRIADLGIRVERHDADGRLLLVNTGIPRLTVNLPPPGVKLYAPEWNLFGETTPGVRVEANGAPLEVGADGRFATTLVLPPGKSRLVVRVTSPGGGSGVIEREVEVARHQLFLLAFADGELGRRKAEGFLEGAGVTDDDDLYAEGRLAFYLKGKISGKYLITAAFDSGKEELDGLFEDFDGQTTRRLLTNLDPDKFYPVYGDSSTVVYDAQSAGKLFLAVESDEIEAVIGNYALSLGDTELAAYRRTLHGGKFSYRSLARTRYGAPETEIALFVADVRQAHIHDELRATGGSIYYLSQRNVVEGSEEVTLVVRDKLTGLLLHNARQVQNVDYQIKYEEGRVIFNRPVSSVVQSGSIVDQEILSGHHVYVHMDYETILDALEKTGSGGRISRQLGDRVAVGATYVEDSLATGPYQLGAVDAELRLGQNSRLIAEFADSEGSDSRRFQSDDGGLTFTERPAAAISAGSAWKAAAELDLGEWFGSPDRYRVNLFYKELEPGFFSSGSFREQATEKMGLHADLALTDSDSIQIRHDNEIREGGGGPTPLTQGETTLNSVQWNRKMKRWGVATEYLSSETDQSGTAIRSSLAAAQFWTQLTDKLIGRLERQQSFEGPANDQSGLTLEYKLLKSLALAVKATDGEIGQSLQVGAVVTRGGATVYLTEKVDEGDSGRKSSTVVGTKAPLGPATQVYSEYQWERSDADDRALSLIGLQQQWDVGDGLRFLLAGEMADVDTAAAQNKRSSLSGSVAWSGSEELKAFSRQEVRFEDGGTSRVQYFTVNQLDYRLSPDLTVLARYRYSRTRDRNAAPGTPSTESRFEERSVGLAFRPVKHDRLNALARYTRLSDQRPMNPGELVLSATQMDVVSIETVLALGRRVEWLGKEAVRFQEERVGDLPAVETRSLLTIQRLNLNLWKPIDLGMEYRILDQHETNQERRGWLTELTWELMQRLRVGAGYNFTDFSDDELSTNDYSVDGWFFRIQGRY